MSGPDPADRQQRTQREVLATYFGLDRQPPVRPNPWTPLVWLGPLTIALLAWASSLGGGIIWAILILVVAVNVYGVALRLRYVTLMERHDGRRPLQRD
ncbi:MAG: hypothetical protein PGN13_11240 [Patulibacter minatonensis]